MLAVPAKIAGCKEIVLCTPPGRDGKVHPAVLFAAKVAGVNRIFKAGGIQAIAAMAHGTEVCLRFIRYLVLGKPIRHGRQAACELA